MSKFEVQSSHYETVKLTAGADITDAPLTLGDIDTFPLISEVKSGEDYAAVTVAENVKAEKAAVAIASGALLYWDDTAKKVTNVSTSNTLIGYANRAAASGDSHVYMAFNGKMI